MKYVKPPLTFEQQADQLIARGLIGERDVLVERLRAVNYYRLSGYLFPYRQPNDTFRPDTTLDEIWNRYTFDRRLRLLIMDPIERIEVHIRTALVYRLAHATGPFGYTAPKNLPGLSGDRFANFLAQIYEQTVNSTEQFVDHFKTKYGGDQSYLPIWMATEIMSFGMTLTLYRGVDKSIKVAIADSYRIPEPVLFSWLKALHAVRNICAHHGRLWNRQLGVKPMIPRPGKFPDWHTPSPIDNARVFGILTICNYCLGTTAPQSQWPQRLTALLDEYPEVPTRSMGFPDNWRTSPLWSDI